MYFLENKGLQINHKDNQWFEELFRHYSKPLFYYAAKFVEDEVARDIVQDVFTKLWSHQTIIIKQSLNALLFKMVRNGCLQHLEKQKVRIRYLEMTKITLQEDELRYYMEESSSLMEQELDNRLNEVINNLPGRCKQIFRLSRFENKRNKEIAEELQISLKAVEKQLTKAMATIRIEMKKYMPLFVLIWAHVFKVNMP
jgi:RNA polymerase sigma-70 factor (ECF subfamily)